MKIHLIRNDPRYGASPDPKTITVDRLKIVSDSTPFFDAYTGIRKKVEAGQELRRNIRKKQLIADNERKTQALQAAATVANQSPLAVLPTGTKRQRKPETTPRKKQRIVSKDVVTASDDEDGAGDGYAGGSGGLTR